MQFRVDYQILQCLLQFATPDRSRRCPNTRGQRGGTMSCYFIALFLFLGRISAPAGGCEYVAYLQHLLQVPDPVPKKQFPCASDRACDAWPHGLYNLAQTLSFFAACENCGTDLARAPRPPTRDALQPPGAVSLWAKPAILCPFFRSPRPGNASLKATVPGSITYSIRRTNGISHHP